jgi:hypothetical protein
LAATPYPPVGREVLPAGFELKLPRLQHAGRDGLAGAVGPNVLYERRGRIFVVFIRRILGQGGGEAACEQGGQHQRSGLAHRYPDAQPARIVHV